MTDTLISDTDFHAMLTPTPAGGTAFRARSLPLDSPVIYGGQLLFVLVPEVRLKPPHYAKDAFNEVAKSEAKRELAAIVEVL